VRGAWGVTVDYAEDSLIISVASALDEGALLNSLLRATRRAGGLLPPVEDGDGDQDTQDAHDTVCDRNTMPVTWSCSPTFWARLAR